MGQRRAVAALATGLRWLLPLSAAAMCVCSPTLGAAQPEDAEAAARRAYVAGVAAFQNGEDAKAQELFAQADAAFPSPNIKLMLARTLAKLGRRVDAYHVLEEALQTAGSAQRYAGTAATAREELRELEGLLALVRLHVADPSPEAALRVDDHLIERAQWDDTLAFEPGSVRIELAEPDGRRDLQQLQLKAGSSVSLDVRVPPLPPLVVASELPPTAAEPSAPAARVDTPSSNSHQLRPISYIVGGVGVAGLAAFGILGTLSNGQFGKLEHACPDARMCDARYRDTATRGQTYQTIANVGLGVGVAALVGGVVLWLWSRPEQSAARDAKPAALAEAPRGLEWTGSF